MLSFWSLGDSGLKGELGLVGKPGQPGRRGKRGAPGKGESGDKVTGGSPYIKSRPQFFFMKCKFLMDITLKGSSSQCHRGLL